MKTVSVPEKYHGNFLDWVVAAVTSKRYASVNVNQFAGRWHWIGKG